MRSIELGWLQRINKELILPELCFAPLEGTAGCYYSPRACEQVIVGDIAVASDHGIIVVSTKDIGSCGAILAHEWRHHYQHCHGWKPDGIGWSGKGDYGAELRRFFSASLIERDALRFEMQHEKADHHELWREILGDDLLSR